MRFDYKILPIILAVLLILGFILRLSVMQKVHVSSRIYSENSSIEYLISNHMIKYKEVPKVGPLGSILDIKHPPTYYYFLSSFLTIKNDYIFLKFVNIFFQLGTILIIFFLAKKMFGTTTALIASTFFTFSQTIIIQSGISFQYHFMQVFLNLSFLTLFISYLKKSFPLLILSMFIFLFAGALAFAGLSVLPLFLGLLVYIIKKNHQKIYFLYSLIFFLGFSLFLFFPAINNILGYQTNIFSNTTNKIIFSPSAFIPTFYKNFSALLNLLFSSLNSSFLNSLVLASICLYFYLVKNKTRKYYVAILILAILLVLFLISIFGLSYPRLFTPVLGLFIILIGEIISSISDKKFLPIKILLILFILNALHSNLALDLLRGVNNVTNLKFDTPPAAESVLNEVKILKKAESIEDFHFFKFHTIYGGKDYANLHAYFWINLESNLDTKFTSIESSDLRNFKVLNEDKYIFLVCYYIDPSSEKTACLDKFKEEYPKHQLVKNIYAKYPVSIYLEKKL